MAHARWLVLLVTAVALSGCFGAEIASWGSGSGEFRVKWNGDVDSEIQVTSRTSGSKYEMNFTAQGCDDEGSVLMGTTGAVTEEVRVSGWLIASQQFPDGVEQNQAEPNMVPASVLIALGPFDEAQENTFENYDKLSIKNWRLPSSVDTMPKLDSKTVDESEWRYAVVALIPATENVLDGFVALDNWQQPIEVVGYAVNTRDPSSGVLSGELTVNSECRATKVGVSGVTMVVTQINLDQGSISASGGASGEWSQGDVPVIGTYLYLLLVLAVGGGGAFFLFMVSTGLERRGAKLTAREMLTEAQVQMARLVKKEVKQAQQDGMDITIGSKRKDEVDDSQDTGATVELDDFDVESVLSGVEEGSLAGMELGGGGVELTEDALDMGDQLDGEIEGGGVNLGEVTDRVGHTLAFDIDDILSPQAEEEEEEESGYGFLGGGRGGGGPSRTTRESSPPEGRKRMEGRRSMSTDEGDERPPPVRRRAVRRSSSDESVEREPAERRGPPKRRAPPKDPKPSVSDDDDFSDFSM